MAERAPARDPARLPGPLVAGPAPLPPRSRRRLSRVRRAAHAVLARVAVWILGLLWSSYRFEVLGHERAASRIESGEPLILTLWHDSVYACGAYFRRLDRLGACVTYLASPSVDGELAVKIIDLLGGRSVRGSATRSGVKAMKGMYRTIVRDSGSPVILPDGPHGPRHICKPGSLLLAELSGAAILPMACAASRAVSLPTWDRAIAPLPFSKVVIAIGEPYTVAGDLDEEALDRETSRLERTLATLAAVAESAVKGSAASTTGEQSGSSPSHPLNRK